MLLNLVNSIILMSSHFYKQDCLQEKIVYGMVYYINFNLQNRAIM